MRIVFMGSPEEVVAPLQTLFEKGADLGLNLVGVISQPARPFGRGGKLADPPVAAFAKLHQITCLQPENAKSEDFITAFQTLEPDVAVTAAYGQILSDQFLAVPKIATINIHPSRLPQYRGATPVPAALLDGLASTAVSILFTVKKLDAGDIILQKDFAIQPEETSGDLTKRLFSESSDLLIEALLKLKSNSKFCGIPQDPNHVTFCKKIDKEFGQVDWNLSATSIVNRYRAFEPWPGTWTHHDGKRIAITAMKKYEGQSNFPASDLNGVFYFDKPSKSILVKTSEGIAALLKLKPAGSKEMDSPSFWNGLKDKSHLIFTQSSSKE